MRRSDPTQSFPSEEDCSAKTGERKKRAPAWVSRQTPPPNPLPQGEGGKTPVFRTFFLLPHGGSRKNVPPPLRGRGLGGGGHRCGIARTLHAAGPIGLSTKNSSLSIIFLDRACPTPYIGPVNARSAPAAARRRPQKKRTKKQAGTFPLSGPPPPIGYPIPHPMRHPLRRRGLTAGLPSGSTLRFRRAVPPGGATPGVERRSRSAGSLENFLSGLFLRHSRIAVSQRFCGVGANREPAKCKKTLWVDRSVSIGIYAEKRRKTAKNRRHRRKKLWNERSKTRWPRAGRSRRPPFCRAIP